MSKLNNQLYMVNNQRQRGNYSPNLVNGPWPYSGDTIGGKEQVGGGPMDSKYVTKEELKTLMDFYPERGGPTLNHEYATKQELQILQAKIEGKIDTLGVKIDSKFENVDSSISDLKSSIPDKISLAIHDQFEKRDHDRKETNHFIIGTLVIGGLSLVVSIVSIIVTIVR
jgi:hypothetical protein